MVIKRLYRAEFTQAEFSQRARQFADILQASDIRNAEHAVVSAVNWGRLTDGPTTVGFSESVAQLRESTLYSFLHPKAEFISFGVNPLNKNLTVDYYLPEDAGGDA